MSQMGAQMGARSAHKCSELLRLAHLCAARPAQTDVCGARRIGSAFLGVKVPGVQDPAIPILRHLPLARPALGAGSCRRAVQCWVAVPGGSSRSRCRARRPAPRRVVCNLSLARWAIVVQHLGRYLVLGAGPPQTGSRRTHPRVLRRCLDCPQAPPRIVFPSLTGWPRPPSAGMHAPPPNGMPALS
jgi:hypothetical protein